MFNACTQPLKVSAGKIFVMFMKEDFYAHQSYIYLIKKYSKNCNIVKYYYNYLVLKKQTNKKINIWIFFLNIFIKTMIHFSGFFKGINSSEEQH